ncbi:MFS transporter [Sphingobium sp. DEHP117]|uniref:MFS transporter n=1 Tax=Sphingobium sp. DEHP117 TaxID=2993436 RepID=UPI0027D4E02A|nr:MFS transporter [Sphingobium sp. DEHP117]MDQ4419697.1 MFS transporter [Sphingobium sp. DEHP117]
MAGKEVSKSDIRLVIGASSAGTVFEWYDFFIYATLASFIGKAFFPSGSETLETLLVWAGFAVGFGFRPLGAILFGYLGDRLGRKYTFLVTVTLMGIATAGVGLIPSADNIGYAAPVLVLLLRICQGLALGGEYGGAAVYVSEHAPPDKRGFYTSFIQASVVGGFVLSLVVVLACKAVIPADAWATWGWRVPFLLSLLLLALSLWMRLKLSESPVFKAMKEEGELAGNPFVESFTYPGNKKRIFVALFGIAAGLTVIWYTAFFSGLTLLKGSMQVEETWAEITVGIAAALGMGFFILFGHISDKVGRKNPIIVGYVLTLLLLFPLMTFMGHTANPGRAAAEEAAPVVVVANECEFDPFSAKQTTPCGQALAELTRLGVQYQRERIGGYGDTYLPASLRIGVRETAIGDPAAIKPALEAAGYDFSKQRPPLSSALVIIACLLGLSALSGMTYGPVAALLAEMFPPKVRYSSMSIPYHIGTGYFGGFLPLVSVYIAARSGNVYAGLWYTFAVVLMALLVCLWGLKETKGGVWAN